MAVTKKGNNNSKKTKSNNYFNISSDKKKKIFGIFLILFSIFLLLSIISYDRRDEANITGLFSVGDQADEIFNWGGIIGANFSNFFIKSTVGYFALIFPFLLFVWGISFYKKITLRILIHISNFLLLSGIIVAAFFGVLRNHYNILRGSYELSGYFGDYLGSKLSSLVGGAVSILLLISTMIILLIFAFDIKIERVFSFIKNLLFTSHGISILDRSKEDVVSATDNNLNKIKKLRFDKKKKKKETVPELTAEDL